MSSGARLDPGSQERHRVARGIYRWLLQLYPEAFRQRFGADMEGDFAALLAEGRVRGALRAQLRAWWIVAVDLAASVPRERLRQLGASRAPTPRKKRQTMGSLGFDLRHALRALRRSPFFTIVSITVLAVGIAAVTATFSLVRHILLRPLPFAEPDRLVVVFEDIPQANLDRFPFSAPDFLDLEQYQSSLAGVAAYSSRPLELAGDGEPERVVASRVSPSLFVLLGAEPILGRTFVEADDRPGSDVVVLSYAFWQRRFSGSPDVVGETLTLERRPHTVIGVLPESVRFPLEHMPFHDQPADLFVPTGFTPLELQARSMMHNHGVLARLAPGMGLTQARADLDLVAQRIHAAYPAAVGERFGLQLHANPLRDEVLGQIERPLMLLLAAMGLVLLVVCANIAGLTVSRVADRGAELSLRAAMGAGRLRLAQVVLLESVVLAVVAAVFAVVLAKLAVAAVVARLGSALPLGARVGVDGWVLAFAFGVTTVAAAISGLAPLFSSRAFWTRAARSETSLRMGSSKLTAGRATVRLQGFLVVATAALAVVLLVGSGLLVRSFLRLTSVDAGFHQKKQVMTFAFTLPSRAYPEAEPVHAFVRSLEEQLEALPGVQRASIGTALPMAVGEIRAMVAEDPLDPNTTPSIVATWTSGPYFESLGIPLRAGRTFTPADRRDAPRVAVVSEDLARKLWGDGDPLGKRIAWGVAGSAGTQWMEVVGVVNDVYDAPLGSQPSPHVYVPYEQLADAELDRSTAVDSPWGRTFWAALLTSGDPNKLIGPAVSVLHEMDGSLPATEVQTMAQVVERGVAPRRLGMAVVSAFGVVALLLAAVGLYGILAYGVARRRREIGVRIALGAGRANVVRSVVRVALYLVVGGAFLGLLGAAASARLLAAVLYETDPFDPWVFAAAPAVLVVAALAASLLPAWRASRVDPMRSLRTE